VCKWVLPPGDNSNAVNKHIMSHHIISIVCCQVEVSVSSRLFTECVSECDCGTSIMRNPWSSRVNCTPFCVLLTVHLGSVFVNNQLEAQFFLSYIFIPVLYILNLHTRQSPTYSDIYQMSY
jgi:hypothetical protein